MKTIITSAIIAVCTLISPLNISAQTSDMFEKISDLENVTSVYVSKAMLSMMGSNIDMGGVNISEIASELNSIEILNITESESISQAKSLLSKLIKESDMELLTKIKEDDEKVTIYGKTAGKITSSIILSVEEPDELVIINITGNIPLDKIKSLSK